MIIIIIIIIIIIYFSHECNLHGTSTMTQEDIHVISIPAGFRRHLVGKTLRNVCHCNIAETNKSVHKHLREQKHNIITFISELFRTDKVDKNKVDQYI